MRATIGQSLNVAGIQFQQQWTREASGGEGYQVAVPVAKSVGTTWTKTNDTEGTATLPDTEWDDEILFDAYWDGGRRYGCSGTVAGDALTITGAGAGDNFPASETPMVFAVPVEIVTLVDGSNLQVFGAIIAFAAGGIGERGVIDIRDDSATVGVFDVRGNVPVQADVAGGQANPIDDAGIELTRVSHANTVAAGTVKLGFLIDATP